MRPEMQIEILPIESKDHYKISEASDIIFQTVPNKSFFSWDSQTLLDELKEKASGIFAMSEKKILGFIIYRESDQVIDIMTLGTLPQARRQGVMGQILEYLLKYSASKNKKVLLEAHEQNRLAIQLYLKKGFQVLYKRDRYYKDGGDALVMAYQPN